MKRGICRHKSVSDRLKGRNRERADTLVGFNCLDAVFIVSHLLGDT